MAQQKTKLPFNGVLPGFEQYYKATYPDHQAGRLKNVPTTNKEEQSPYSNLLSRTSLFAPVNRVHREMLHQKKMHSPENTTVIYTGEQLNASDQDVLLTLLHQIKGHAPSTFMAHTIPQWLKLCGRKGRGKDAYDWFRTTVNRLQANHLYIKGYGFEAGFSLISEYLREESTDRLMIKLADCTVAMFHSGCTYINLDRRYNLKSEMAKCLQCFICSHAKGDYVIELEDLQLLLNNKSRVNDFRKRLVNALQELEDANEIIRPVVEKKIAKWRRLAFGE